MIHRKRLVQAQYVLRWLAERFGQCGLELHPEKTRIVYCQRINLTADYPTIQLTFPRYIFCPRKAVDEYGWAYMNFAPAVSREALRAMRHTVRTQAKCSRHC